MDDLDLTDQLTDPDDFFPDIVEGSMFFPLEMEELSKFFELGFQLYESEIEELFDLKHISTLNML